MQARYVIDFLFEASSEELYQKFYKDIPQDIYNKIIKADPTSSERNNGKYCKWLLDMYINKKLLIEDLYKATEYLVLFNKYNNKISKNNIQSYKSLQELFDEIEQFQENTPKEELVSNNDTKNDIKKNQTKKVFEDNEWIVVVPLTETSSCFWGLGTQWCTASKEPTHNAFEYYNSKGPLYIIISKKLKDTEKRQIKYQFHFESDSYMDSKDNTINKNDSNNFSDSLLNFLEQHHKQDDFISICLWINIVNPNSKKINIVEKEINDAFKSNTEIAKNYISMLQNYPNLTNIRNMIYNIIISDKNEYKISPSIIYEYAKDLGYDTNNKLFESLINMCIKYNDFKYVCKWAESFGNKKTCRDILLKYNTSINLWENTFHKSIDDTYDNISIDISEPSYYIDPDKGIIVAQNLTGEERNKIIDKNIEWEKFRTKHKIGLKSYSNVLAWIYSMANEGYNVTEYEWEKIKKFYLYSKNLKMFFDWYDAYCYISEVYDDNFDKSIKYMETTLYEIENIFDDEFGHHKIDKSFRELYIEHQENIGYN